ncbi:MAG: hypothetical protein HY593_00850 [Candidatus Omnitrophica bacterium]|nr:hypothetical protein [Candidatus Omnitrophota bacterium]
MKTRTTVKISRVLKGNETKLLKKSNVVGVGIGEKIKDGKRTGRTCLRVYVEKKLAKERLSKNDLVPSHLSEIETDVVEVGKIRPLASNRWRNRPARGGASIGHYQITAGTLGCLVKDKKTGKTLILSNNHVLANSNKAKKDDAIIQPGAADGGKNPKDKIAGLERWVKVGFGKSANTVDAALAFPLNEKDVSPEISSIGMPKGTTKGRAGLIVQKTGRTTDHTLGEIQDTSATVKVDYDGKTALFRNQILTSAMSQGGDSGSLVLDQKRRAVGLLFAGSPLVTICNPIQDVLKHLAVTVH